MSDNINYKFMIKWNLYFTRPNKKTGISLIIFRSLSSIDRIPMFDRQNDFYKFNTSCC